MLPCSAVMLMAVVMLGSGVLAALSAAWADKRLIHGRGGGRREQTVVSQTSGRREGGPRRVAALDESDGGFEETGSPHAFLRFLYFRDRQEMLAKIFVGFIASVGDALQYLALALLPSEVWSVQQQLRAACICFFLYMLRGVVLGFNKYMFLLNLVISVMFFSLAGAAAGEAGDGEAGNGKSESTLLVGTCVMILAQVVCALGSILEEVIFKVEVDLREAGADIASAGSLRPAAPAEPSAPSGSRADGADGELAGAADHAGAARSQPPGPTSSEDGPPQSFASCTQALRAAPTVVAFQERLADVLPAHPMSPLDEEQNDLPPAAAPTCRRPGTAGATSLPEGDEEQLSDEELPEEEQETEEEPIVRPRRRRTGFRAKLTHMASRHESRDMESLWRRYCAESGHLQSGPPGESSSPVPRGGKKTLLPPVKMGNRQARAFRRAAQQHFIVGCWMIPSGILEGKVLAWLRGSPVGTAGVNQGGVSTTAPPAAPPLVPQASHLPHVAHDRTALPPVVDVLAAGTPFVGFDNLAVVLTLLACIFYIHMRALTTTYVSALAVSVGQTVANVPFFVLWVLILDGVFDVSQSSSGGGGGTSPARGLQFLALVGVLAAAMGYAFTDRPETAAREAGRFRRVVGRLPWTTLRGGIMERRRSFGQGGTRGQANRTIASRGGAGS